MKTHPVETFSRAVSFIGLDVTRTEIEAALDKSSFDRLKKQEEEKGFLEKDAKSTSFFRKGIAGDWKNSLNEDQVNSILRTQGKIMKRFNYA